MSRVALIRGAVLILGVAALPFGPLAPAGLFAEGGRPGHHHEETELSKQMESLEDAYKDLRKSLGAPQPDSAKCADLAGKIKAAAAKSKTLTPEKAAKLPEGDRAKFLQDYQKSMDEFIASAGKLQDACKAGNWSEARKLMDVLRNEKGSGHKAYRVSDD